MQAIQIQAHGGPDVMALIERPTPTPAEGQLLVQVEAAGVNFIDIYQRSGAYRLELPAGLGLEGAGRVEAIGENVDGIAIGDRVAWTGIAGSYATHVVATADRVVRLPERIDTRTAAAAMLQGLTAHYLACSTFPLKLGDVCLIHAAAGGVGLLLCQIAKLLGAHVIGTVSTREKAERAQRAGADETIIYTEVDFQQEVLRLTRNEKVSVVYDSVGKTTFDKGLDSLRPCGTMVLFGQASGPVPPLDLQVLNAKGSLFVTRPKLNDYIATRQQLEARASELFRWIEEGQLAVEIHETFPLAEAARAHASLESRATTGKLLLIP